MTFKTKIKACLLGGAVAIVVSNGSAVSQEFNLSSPELASGSFDDNFILNGFGCAGGNVSPALEWSNVPEGTKSR